MRWKELEAAIETTAWSEALELALQGWRERRHAALADLVDLLASRVTEEPVAARVADQGSFQETWLALAEAGRAADMGPLLASVARSLPMPQRAYWEAGTMPVRYAPWLARLAALERLPNDPRVATALFEIVHKAPWTGGWGTSDTADIYDSTLALLGRTGDERLLAPMRTLHAAPVASRQVVRTYLAEALPGAIASIEDARAKRRPLEEEEVARCERLIDALGGRLRRADASLRSAPSEDEDALLELVLGDLEDDGPREVLSDFWLERGDPRGELVTLQLRAARKAATEADEKAVRALLREHERAWLGELALVTKSRVFARGFLDEVELLQNAAAEPKVWESAPLSPSLATVRTIHKGKANETHYRRFVLSPMARSLRELTVISKGMLAEACGRAAPWPIQHLALAFMPDKKVLDSIVRSTAFPRLTKVTLGLTEGKVDKVLALAAPFTHARKLQCIAVTPLRFYLETGPLAAWLEAARGSLAHVAAVELTLQGGQSIIARAGKTGLRVELVTEHLYFGRSILPGLRQVEQLVLRLPQGVGEPSHREPDDAANVLAALRPASLETDEGWTRLLARSRRNTTTA
jgi:uncharacterized protein (TIGR02996 family)